MLACTTIPETDKWGCLEHVGLDIAQPLRRFVDVAKPSLVIISMAEAGEQSNPPLGSSSVSNTCSEDVPHAWCDVEGENLWMRFLCLYQNTWLVVLCKGLNQALWISLNHPQR
jgi:hypothetical protein